MRRLDGPWILYDNREDPDQLHNLVDNPDFADLQKEMEHTLSRLLVDRGDPFLPARHYTEQYGFDVRENGAIPYTV